MALPDFEQIYLDEAIEYITKQKDFTGNEGKERYGVVINLGEDMLPQYPYYK